MSDRFWALVLVIIIILMVCGCASNELISPAKQACYDERDRIRAEIWEAQREHMGRVTIVRAIPRCGRIK